MTKRFLSCVALGGCLLLNAGLGRAQTRGEANDDNPTAYSALRLVSKTVGRDALDRVVEVTGRDGVPQPYLWKVILKEGAGSREIDVTGGKIGAQRELARPPESDVPIHFTDLNLDSSGAFDATDGQARKVKLRYDSLNYALRVNPSSGKPVWHIDLIDKEGREIGAIRLAAHDGTILSTDGRLAHNPPPVVKPAAAPVTITTARSPGPLPTPRPVEHPTTVHHEEATVATTTVHHPESPVTHTTTTTTTSTQDIPVATLSDRDDNQGAGAPPPPPPDEQGGLFTRTGRTLDHTTHTVDHTFRKAGATVQRFFTGHSDLDHDGQRTN